MSWKARKFKAFFRPKLGDLQKKKGLRQNSERFFGRNTKFKGFFRPKLGDLQKKKKKVFTQGPSRFSPELTQISSQKLESLMPNLQRGGHASILLTLLCNFAILATQRGGPWPNGPPLNTPLALPQTLQRLSAILDLSRGCFLVAHLLRLLPYKPIQATMQNIHCSNRLPPFLIWLLAKLFEF